MAIAEINARLSRQPVEHWVLLVWLVWLTFEYIGIGSASVIYFADNVESFLPPLLSREFAGLDNPLWDRFTAAGIDYMGLVYEVPIVRFLFGILPGWLAHGFIVTANYVAAVLATYVLARRTLRLSRAAGVFAAIFYSVLIPPQLMVTATGLLPMLILAVGFVLENPGRAGRWLGLILAILLMSWTTYFTQLIPYASIFVFVWFIFVDPRTRFRDWVIIIPVCITVPLLRFQEFHALFTLAPLSHLRYTRVVAEIGETLERFRTFDFLFSGPARTTATVLMIGALIVPSGFRKRLVSIFVLILLCGGLFAVASIWFQHIAAKILPFLSGYTVQYFSSLGDLALGMGGAAGVYTLWPRIKNAMPDIENNKAGAWAVYAVAGLIITALIYPSLILKYANGLNWVTRGTFARHFESPVLKDLSAKIRAQPFPERVEGYQIASAVLSGYGLETLGGDPPFYYRQYYEYFAKLVEPWAKGIFDDVWIGPQIRQKHEKIPGDMMFRGARLMLYPADYKPEVQLDALYRLNMMSLANVAYIVSRDRLIAPGLKEIRSRPKPWSALSHADKTRENVKANFRGMEDLYVYRNTRVLPRFFSPTRVLAFGDKDKLLDAIATSPTDTLRTTLFIENNAVPDALTKSGPLGDLKIRLTEYTSDKIRLALNSDRPTVLAVMNTYSPFWTAEIDGKNARIFPAYHAFWGLFIPPGSKEVVIRYKPPYAWR